jgi:hypothetical protein
MLHINIIYMLQNLNWQFIFKRFIICFIILNMVRIIVLYIKSGVVQIPSAYATRSFTFALLYALFSGYMHSKNNTQQ